MQDELHDPLGKASAYNRPVTVRVPAAVAYDLDKAQQIQREVLGRLGCTACCSGFDIRFILENEFIADHDLNVREIGGLGRG